MNATCSSIYYETFSEAIDAAEAQLDVRNAHLTEEAPEPGNTEPEWKCRLSARGPVNYEQTLQMSFQIAALNGRATKKYFHVSIYRTDAGRYELTTYIL